MLEQWNLNPFNGTDIHIYSDYEAFVDFVDSYIIFNFYIAVFAFVTHKFLR